MWVYLGIGLVAGTIVSSWQGYKDPPWEGFAISKFVRSIAIGGAIGLVVFVFQARGRFLVDNLGLLLLSILATERLVGETYKGFLRTGEHPEYFKLFERLGLPMRHRALRAMFGLVALSGGLCLYWLFGRLGARIIAAFGPTALAGLLIGGAAGTMAAVGGAVKDSQFEGFKPGKFLRSPIMTALGGTVLVGLSQNPLLVSIGAVGLERVVVEFYKTFVTRQVRGIHAERAPAHPEWLGRRWLFLLSFVSCVAACIVLLAR